MSPSSLIPADQHWSLWAVLLVVAAFGLWAEKTRWGARLSGAVIAILGTFVLSNLSVIPTAAPVYDVVWSYLVPLAIPLLLFKADLRRIIREAGPTLLAFVFGAVGTVIGTVLAFSVIPLGEHGYQLAGIFCATYIGGSMNFAAAAEALQLQAGDLLSAGVAADNLVMTLYFLLLFAMPSFGLLRRFYPTAHDEGSAAVATDDAAPAAQQGGVGLQDMAKALAIGAVLCAIGFGVQGLVGIRGSAILIVTALVVALATLFPRQLGGIAGADQLGTMLMQIFFAVIGASANIAVVIKVGPVLFIFAAIILTVHLLFLLGAGKLFKLDLAELIVASNANMGGPTTAAAMAVARRWHGLVIPAILCGTLGYAVATFIGVAVGLWLR